ncbi:MAG: hypothetical protein M0025_10920 [Elusimicrobia bacterium]|nr:hypothetical protein [Elusimicrobiota bacterium]
MKKTVLFALPLAALMLAVACKKQEAAPAAPEQAVSNPAEAAPVAVATSPAAVPAAAPAEKKGK